MFDDKFFEQWLDNQAQKIMDMLANGQSISPEQMMVLVLKAQTNHFAHLDIELREDIQVLDKRLSGEMQRLGVEMQNMNERLSKEMQELRKDMDKRFEQVDKRFEMLTSRIDHFMIWSFATTFTMGSLVVAAIKFLP